MLLATLRRTALAGACLLAGIGCAGVALPEAPDDALALVRALQASHRAPSTVTFTQDADHLAPDGSVLSTSVMHEWLAVPGRLRIDVLGDDPGTVLFHPAGRTLVRPDGTQESPRVSVVMLLMLDVFAEDPASWLARAAAAGLDTSVVSASVFEERPAFLLGARPGQLDRVQLWVDAETLLPVRYVELSPPAPDGRTHVLEGRAHDYRDFDGAVFHTRFTFLSDGVPVLEERYRDVRVDQPLPDDVFDPAAVARRFATGG